MKKSSLIFLFLINFFLQASDNLISSTTFSETSITILYRFYCINRLNKMVETLFLLHKKMQKKGAIDYHTEKKYVQLKVIWQDFTAYKNLDSKDSVHNVIEYIFLLSQTFLSQESIMKDFSSFKKNQLVQEIDTTIEINEILLRFYHLKRLSPFISFLKILETKKIIPFSEILTSDISSVGFKTTPVLYAINSLQQDHTFEEFFILWDILNQYIYIKDTYIISEYTKALYYLFFITIKNLSHHSKDFFQSKSFTLEQLQTLPLADILNLLDIMVEELPHFLEKTELDSKLSWKEWAKKYWLIAPASAILLAIRIYMIHTGNIFPVAKVASTTNN